LATIKGPGKLCGVMTFVPLHQHTRRCRCLHQVVHVKRHCGGGSRNGGGGQGAAGAVVRVFRRSEGVGSDRRRLGPSAVGGLFANARVLLPSFHGIDRCIDGLRSTLERDPGGVEALEGKDETGSALRTRTPLLLDSSNRIHDLVLITFILMVFHQGEWVGTHRFADRFPCSPP